ncbi:MAG TPA: ankyrin repeat domain-containing protein [Candidatus Rhabdochlamydia sp.]|jgi:Ankyrin repeats (many copies)|nr:ankyrin repeat domain-containing protein [Candidatus Rhabdochlamydia sp.]
MPIQLTSQYLLLNPPKHIVADLLIQPYALGYAYLTHAINTRCENRPNLKLYEKVLCVLIGASLLIPIVNTIMYVALRVLCSYNRQTTETDQIPPPASNFDKAPYIQPIQEARNQAHTVAQKIKDSLIKKDIQDFINEISETAQQLIETLSDIDLCSSITENAQQELFCTKEQIQYLVDTQEEGSISALSQPITISENALNWAREISKVTRENNKNQFTILLEEGKNNNFINLKFRHFLGGTLFHHFSKMEWTKDYFISLISAGIDPSLQDNWGNTGLIWAIANARNTNALLILQELGQGSYLDIQCSLHKNTALHLAITKGYKDRSKHGECLTVSNLELVNTLLRLKANPNLQTKEGYTPLHLACARRDNAMISALIKAGADPDIKDNKGQTPKDLLSIGYSEASKILRKNTCDTYLLNEEEYEANLETAQNLF